MAIPPTALKLGKTLDPTDVKEAVINYLPLLQAGEQIASFTITLSAAAVALGMSIPNTGPRAVLLINDNTAIQFWPLIDIDEQANPAFDGAGVSLDIEVTIITTADPTRTDQQTFLIPWAQK